MKKRYYQVDERVWIVNERTDGIVKDINIEDKEMTVEYKDERGQWRETTRKFWDFDKYRKGEDATNSKSNNTTHSTATKNYTYFASVKGGVVPKKSAENAGRDCFVRLDAETRSIEHDGIYLQKNKVSKVPLGFASYLNQEDLLYIGMERSSVGALGILVLSGLIDSTYQGEVIAQLMPLTKDVVITDKVKEVEAHDNIIYFPASKALVQAVVLKQSSHEDKEIEYEELLKKPSSRGTKGWGSTDKK